MDFIKIASLILVCILVSLVISIIALYDCGENFNNYHISGMISACLFAGDSDCDGVPDSDDNCINVTNPRIGLGQIDSDNDNFGNACDTDLNNDCRVDVVDSIIFLIWKYDESNLVCDFNTDGKIDVNDQEILIKYRAIGKPGPSALNKSCDTPLTSITTTSTTSTTSTVKTISTTITSSSTSSSSTTTTRISTTTTSTTILTTTTLTSSSTTTTIFGSTSTTTTVASSTTTTTTILSGSEMSQSSTTTTISSTTTIIQGETTTKKIILKLNIISPQDNEEYQKGDRINIIGNVKDDSGNSISKVLVKITFSGPESWKRELKSMTDNSGSFYYEYPIGFGDPDGQWDLTLIATDNSGNQNTVNLKISVKSRPEMTYYTVNFLSPSANITYKKGDRTSIQVEVRREDSMISNALVNCKSPTSSVFQLSESGNGMYSGYYDIRFIDPSGVWSITCEVQKIEEGKTLYGGSFINVKIDPANLKIDLISPKSNNLDYGKKTDFIVNLTYPDNEPVSSAMVLLKFQGQSIVLSEMERGIYKTSVQTKSVGIINASLNAKDINENTGNLEKAFVIKATLLGFLYINWYVLPLSIGSLISTLFSFKYYSMRVPNKINNLEKKIQQIDEMRVSTEKEYFMRKIDEKTFKNLMENYKQNKLECQVILNELRRESEPISESNN